MMKLILSLTVMWTLCSTAGALRCLTCTNLQCSTTESQNCTSETMCITASIQANSSGTIIQQLFKACAPSSLCQATGAQTFSVNLGVQGAVASAECCNTDDCNSESLAFPATQAANSLQCFSCNPMTGQCTTALQCKGVEDRCFQTNLTDSSSSSPAFGCTSENLCAAATSLPFMEIIGTISSGPTCCDTSLCNTVTTTAAPTTTPTPTTTTTTASDACCIRLGMIHLLLGLLLYTLC